MSVGNHKLLFEFKLFMRFYQKQSSQNKTTGIGACGGPEFKIPQKLIMSWTVKSGGKYFFASSTLTSCGMKGSK